MAHKHDDRCAESGLHSSVVYYILSVDRGALSYSILIQVVTVAAGAETKHSGRPVRSSAGGWR